MKKLFFLLIAMTWLSCESQNFITTQKQSNNHKNYDSGNTIPQQYDGLDTDLTTYTNWTTQTKPAYLGSIVDDRFGTTITRITGDDGVAIPNTAENWKNIARHGYSTRQPWNADESILYINTHKTDGGTWGSSLFLNGETYEVIKTSSIPSANESRWHPTDPDVWLLLRDTEVVGWSYANETETQLYSFAGYTGTSMGFTGNWSDDGNVVAMSATRTSDAKLVVFAVNTDTDTKYPDIDASGWTDVDFVTISPLGTYIVINGDFGGGGDRSRIYNATTGVQVGAEWSGNGQPSHYDVTINELGEEVVVGGGRSSPYDGKIMARRMSDGNVIELSTAGYNGHSSARAVLRNGWVITGMSNSLSWPPYHGEIVAAKADGTRVERIVQHRSSKFVYDAQHQAVVSPSGGRVLYASDWNTSTYPIQTYVVDFRHMN